MNGQGRGLRWFACFQRIDAGKRSARADDSVADPCEEDFVGKNKTRSRLRALVHSIELDFGNLEIGFTPLTGSLECGDMILGRESEGGQTSQVPLVNFRTKLGPDEIRVIVVGDANGQMRIGLTAGAEDRVLNGKIHICVGESCCAILHGRRARPDDDLHLVQLPP